jgi:hypothetical protein
MFINFLLATLKNKKFGRCNGNNWLAIFALEKAKDGVGIAYAQIIERASAEEFKPFFKNYIQPEANVITDEWVRILTLEERI